MTSALVAIALLDWTPRIATMVPTGDLVFADEFTGTALDASRWRTCSWWADTTCSIESNAEQELYTPNNVSVANGVLKLQARKENAVAWNGKTYNYTSGMISSDGRSGAAPPGFTFKYGYMESRMKIQYLLLNLAVGGNWPGPPNSSTAFPSDFLVDYVRVWDRSGAADPPLPFTVGLASVSPTAP